MSRSVPGSKLKVFVFTVVAGLLIFAGAACSNDLERFCQEATSDMCHKCFECASNNDAASTMCGLLVVSDEEGCRTLLHDVCASDDNVYNAETGRSCQDRIGKLTCEQLETEGKPEVCGRLF